MTSAVERLVRQGYVERLRREHDRRVVLASLTDAGRDVVDEATAGLNAHVFESPGIPVDDVLRLTELLGELPRGRGRPRGDPALLPSS